MTREEFVRNRSWILRVIRSRCELTQTEEDYLNDLIEVLEQEPCDCISRKRLKECFHRNVAGAEAFDTIIDMQPSIQPTTKENLVVEDCISRQAVLDLVEDMTDQFGVGHRVITEGVISMLPPVAPQPKTDVLEKIKEEIKNNTYFINETTEKEGIDIETVEKTNTERSRNDLRKM